MFSHQVMSDSLQPHGLQHTSFSVLCYLSEFAQIHVCWVSDAIQPSRSLSSPSPPAFYLSQHRVFSKGSALHIRWPKLQLQYQSFQWAFKVDFLYDWLVWSYKTKRLSIQHHSLKASILWYSIFFTVQLSHSYITPQKTINLTIWIFVDKVISLLFNRLHRFVIIFLPRN